MLDSRPYDALYDAGTYTVSGARDHFRQQAAAGGFQVERAPNYPAMFSELPHHPATAFRFKNASRVPGFVDRSYRPAGAAPGELAARSTAAAVNGAQRYKYMRRPQLAAPAPIIIKAAAQAAQAPAPVAPPEPMSKTIGTQSDYRENEAQTAPWEPPAAIPEAPSAKQAALSAKHHIAGPELQALHGMTFGDGLPPGLQEVRRIEAMREKRAFEASLPPIDDIDNLPLRQRMIEEWEAKEWATREDEIRSVQDERLELLTQALVAREEEFETTATMRVDQRKMTGLERTANRVAGIQAARCKTMRHLVEARKYVEKPRKLHKLAVVEKYAQYSSSMYAPLQREGRFPDSGPAGKPVETEGFAPATLQGLSELEATLPAKMIVPRTTAPPRKPARLDYAGRKDAAVQRDLKAINDLLDAAKSGAGRGIGECWPAPLQPELLPASASMRRTLDARAGETPMSPKRPPSSPSAKLQAKSASPPRKATRVPERPPTPRVEPNNSARQHAATLLQKLLRGRAAQNAMYEGRMRRAGLIAELLLEAGGEGAVPVGTRPEVATHASTELDALVGAAMSALAAAMAEGDDGARADVLAALMADVGGSRPPTAPYTPRPTTQERRAEQAEKCAAAALARVEAAAAERPERSTAAFADAAIDADGVDAADAADVANAADGADGARGANAVEGAVCSAAPSDEPSSALPAVSEDAAADVAVDAEASAVAAAAAAKAVAGASAQHVSRPLTATSAAVTAVLSDMVRDIEGDAAAPLTSSRSAVVRMPAPPQAGGPGEGGAASPRIRSRQTSAASRRGSTPPADGSEALSGPSQTSLNLSEQDAAVQNMLVESEGQEATKDAVLGAEADREAVAQVADEIGAAGVDAGVDAGEADEAAPAEAEEGVSWPGEGTAPSAEAAQAGDAAEAGDESAAPTEVAQDATLAGEREQDAASASAADELGGVSEAEQQPAAPAGAGEDTAAAEEQPVFAEAREAASPDQDNAEADEAAAGAEAKEQTAPAEVGTAPADVEGSDDAAEAADTAEAVAASSEESAAPDGEGAGPAEVTDEAEPAEPAQETSAAAEAEEFLAPAPAEQLHAAEEAGQAAEGDEKAEGKAAQDKANEQGASHAGSTGSSHADPAVPAVEAAA